MMLLIQLPLTIDAQQETDTSTGCPVVPWEKKKSGNKGLLRFPPSSSRIPSDPSKSHLLSPQPAYASL